MIIAKFQVMDWHKKIVNHFPNTSNEQLERGSKNNIIYVSTQKNNADIWTRFLWEKL